MLSDSTKSDGAGQQIGDKRGSMPMSVTIAINGFGRIGRLLLRALLESGRDDLVPIAINDLGSIETNSHLAGAHQTRCPGSHFDVDQGGARLHG
jgi:hypothetical protein